MSSAPVAQLSQSVQQGRFITEDLPRPRTVLLWARVGWRGLCAGVGVARGCLSPGFSSSNPGAAAPSALPASSASSPVQSPPSEPTAPPSPAPLPQPLRCPCSLAPPPAPPPAGHQGGCSSLARSTVVAGLGPPGGVSGIRAVTPSPPAAPLSPYLSSISLEDSFFSSQPLGLGAQSFPARPHMGPLLVLIPDPTHTTQLPLTINSHVRQASQTPHFKTKLPPPENISSSPELKSCSRIHLFLLVHQDPRWLQPHLQSTLKAAPSHSPPSLWWGPDHPPTWTQLFPLHPRFPAAARGSLFRPPTGPCTSDLSPAPQARGPCLTLWPLQARSVPC